MTATQERYRLDRRIATGGMGEVWAATDTVLGREVAVKLLKSEYADDVTSRTRFRSEAQHAASLDHPNVATVFDFGEQESDSGGPRPYLVMELVDGQPLSALLRPGQPMPPERAANLVGQAADAVAAAHALGIVHRDIKPANILVTRDGEVKITDFGIARAADAAALTRTGEVVGTPQYLSPEQAQGKPATPASDVYALGVVLYECLAGRRPFEAETPVVTALAHLNEDPPPLPGSVPTHLREATMRALAKDPQDRHASAGDFAAAIRVTGAPAEADTAVLGAGAMGGPPATRVLTDPGMSPARRPRSRRGMPGWLPWAGAGVGILLLVLLLVLLGNNASPPATNKHRPSAGQSTATQQSSPSRSPSPSTIMVDRARYLGMPAVRAKRRLTSLGLHVTEQPKPNDGTHTAGTVADIAPTGPLSPGTTVTLSVWSQPPPPPPEDGGHGGKHGKHKEPGHGKHKGHD